MEYINTFLNLSAFTEAKPNLPYPSLSLIENTNQVYYIKKKPLIKVTLNVSEEYSNKELPLGGFEFVEASSTVDEIINLINQVVFPKELCEDVIIDGVSVGPINTYTFTAGKHTVEYAMKDETKVVDLQFCYFGILGIESVEIPDSVTSIGYGAFGGCIGLTTITIPDSVTSIGDSAFGECTGLTSITIPDSVTSIGSGAFVYCNGLTSITIPDSVTSIGDRAFEGCPGLKTVDLTSYSKLTSIGDNAFSGCNGLTSITIPDSVTSIGVRAFEGCFGLKTVDLTSYSKLTSIENYAFNHCTGLTSITIPDSVTSIGDKAFYYCSILREVTYKGKIYTSKRELLNDLEINNVETGSYAFEYTGLGA